MHEAKYKRGHPRIHRHDTIFSITVSDPGQTSKSPKTIKKRDNSSDAHGPLRPQHLPRKHSRFSWYLPKCTGTFLHWQPQVHNDAKVDAKNDLRFSLLLYGACLLKEPTKARAWSGCWGHLLEPAPQAQGSHPPASTAACGLSPGHSSNSGKSQVIFFINFGIIVYLGLPVQKGSCPFGKIPRESGVFP